MNNTQLFREFISNKFNKGGSKKKQNNSFDANKSYFLKNYNSAWKGTRYDTPEWRAFWTELASRESSFRPQVTNSIGAKGYFQLMPFNRAAKWSNDIEQFKEADKLVRSIERQITKEDLKKAEALGLSKQALIAGAWLGGVGGMRAALNGKNKADMNGTTVMGRMKAFNNLNANNSNSTMSSQYINEAYSDPINDYLNTPIGASIDANQPTQVVINNPISEGILYDTRTGEAYNPNDVYNENQGINLGEAVVVDTKTPNIPTENNFSQGLLEYAMNNQPEFVGNALDPTTYIPVTQKVQKLAKADIDARTAAIEDNILRANINNNLANSQFKYFFNNSAEQQKKDIQELQFIRAMNNISAYGGNLFVKGGNTNIEEENIDNSVNRVIQETKDYMDSPLFQQRASNTFEPIYGYIADYDKPMEEWNAEEAKQQASVLPYAQEAREALNNITIHPRGTDASFAYMNADLKNKRAVLGIEDIPIEYQEIFTVPGVVKHELSHLMYTNKSDNSLNYTPKVQEYFKKAVLSKKNMDNVYGVDNWDSASYDHDQKFTELSAIINEARQDMKDAGIWDYTTGQEFTKEHYDLYKKLRPRSRFINYFPWETDPNNDDYDEDPAAKWLQNNLAYQNYVDNTTHYAANGGNLFISGGDTLTTTDLNNNSISQFIPQPIEDNTTQQIVQNTRQNPYVGNGTWNGKPLMDVGLTNQASMKGQGIVQSYPVAIDTDGNIFYNENNNGWLPAYETAVNLHLPMTQDKQGNAVFANQPFKEQPKGTQLINPGEPYYSIGSGANIKYYPENAFNWEDWRKRQIYDQGEIVQGSGHSRALDDVIANTQHSKDYLDIAKQEGNKADTEIINNAVERVLAPTLPSNYYKMARTIWDPETDINAPIVPGNQWLDLAFDVAAPYTVGKVLKTLPKVAEGVGTVLREGEQAAKQGIKYINGTVEDAAKNYFNTKDFINNPILYPYAKVNNFVKKQRLGYTLEDLEKAQAAYDSRIVNNHVEEVKNLLNGQTAKLISEKDLPYYQRYANEGDAWFQEALEKHNLYREIESRFPEAIKQSEQFRQFRNLSDEELLNATTETINIGGKDYRYIKPEYDSYIDSVYDDSFYLVDPIEGTLLVNIPESEKVYNLNDLIGLKPPKVSKYPKDSNPVDYAGYEAYQQKVINKINQDIASDGPLSRFMSRNNLTTADILPYLAHPTYTRYDSDINSLISKYINKNLKKQHQEFYKTNSDKYFGMGQTIPDEETYVKKYFKDHPNLDPQDSSDELLAISEYRSTLQQMDEDFMNQYPEIAKYVDDNYDNAFSWHGFTYTPLHRKDWGDTVSHELSHLMDGNYYGVPGGRNGSVENRPESLLFNLSFNPTSTGHKNYFFRHNGTEYEARGTQMKNYYNSDELTGSMLKQAGKKYVKDTGRDNNITDMFRSILDYDAAAKWMSAHAKGFAAPTLITTGAGTVLSNQQALGGNLFSSGGDIEQVLPEVIVQDNYSTEDQIKNVIESQWESAKNLEPYYITKDPTFTRERTGAGSIEYFNQPAINYNNNPGPITDNIIYNPNNQYDWKTGNLASEPTLLFDPKSNTVDDIKLDLLHHYREYDPIYQERLKEYQDALMSDEDAANNVLWNSELGRQFREKYRTQDDKGKIKYTYDQHMDEWDKLFKENKNNNEYLIQGIDGSLRNLLANNFTRTHSNYQPLEEAQKQWLADQKTRQAFNALNNYLTSGIDYKVYKPNALGGPLFNSRTPIESFQGGKPLPIVRQ